MCSDFKVVPWGWYGAALRLVPTNSSTMLDVGCGDGGFLALIGRKGVRFGIDTNLKAIKTAKDHGHAILADAHHLPLRHHYFDVVTCLEVLEHVDSPINCLKEVKRVLKEEGTFIVSVPNVVSPYRVFRNWLRPLSYKTPIEHRQGWDPGLLFNLLTTNGFIIKKITGSMVMPILGRFRFLWSVASFLGRSFPTLSNNLVYLARNECGRPIEANPKRKNVEAVETCES